MKTILLTSLLAVEGMVAAPGDVYHNQEHRFSIDAPAGWAVTKSAQPNTVVKFVHRDSEGRLAVLSIAAYRGSNIRVTPDSMYASFREEYRDFTYIRLASGRATLHSMEAVWNVIEITDPPQARVIGKHYHFVRNGKLWRVSAMTDSGKEFFAKLLPVMDQAIATLAFGL